VIDHNFTIYAGESWFAQIMEMEFTKRARFVMIDYYEVSSFLSNLTHGSNRAQLLITLNTKNFDDTENYKCLDEKIICEQLGIKLPLNHFMFDALDDKIVKLTESGIIENIVKGTFSPKQNDAEPTVLQLDHLLIWFILWIALLLITTFMFFGEVLVGKVFKFRKKKASKRKVKRKVKT
jgi:hypothetical protein